MNCTGFCALQDARSNLSSRTVPAIDGRKAKRKERSKDRQIIGQVTGGWKQGNEEGNSSSWDFYQIELGIILGYECTATSLNYGYL